MSLPDPETTDAEPVPIDDDTVLDAIPEDNPFKAAIEELHDAGESWSAIWDLLEDVYNPVDSVAWKVDSVRLPEYELEVVVYDEQATSGERYETLQRSAATESEASEWAESKHGVRRVESIEQVGMVTVS